MKTTEDFIREMERSNILLSREFTFKEYVSELIQFQNMVCMMVAGDAYHERMRFDEATFIMESTARKRGLRSHPAVHNGLLAMKKLEKEMAITISGSKGESRVSRTLEFLERPNTQIFHNVYIADGEEETELDAVVLTDSSIIILEVKNVKSDITLTEDGRMVFADDACYDKIPLAKKMQLKRRLLKKSLEKAIAERGLSIPVYVDSFIVFSAPQGKFIRINDRYRSEKHCFRSNLNKKIENYLGCAYYKADQINQLGTILAEMEANVRRFESDLNYDEIRLTLAAALAVLQKAPSERECFVEEPKISVEEQNTANIIELDEQFFKPTRQQVLRKASGFGCVAACAVAGVLISGAAAMLNWGSRHV